MAPGYGYLVGLMGGVWQDFGVVGAFTDWYFVAYGMLMVLGVGSVEVGVLWIRDCWLVG